MQNGCVHYIDASPTTNLFAVVKAIVAVSPLRIAVVLNVLHTLTMLLCIGVVGCVWAQILESHDRQEFSLFGEMFPEAVEFSEKIVALQTQWIHPQGHGWCV